MKPTTELNDRELLELAAEYCGYEYRPQNGCIVVDGLPCKWNPLTDAGDRARMCDDLLIAVVHWDEHMGIVSAENVEENTQRNEYYSDHNNNRTAAANYAAVMMVAMMQLAKQET